MQDYNSSTTKPLFRATQVVWYLLGLLEVLLAFRFILRALAANAGAGFTQFIYSVSYPFVAPFQAVFRVNVVSGSVIEWTTLLAMFVYWLVALGIAKLLVMNRPVSTPEAAMRLRRQE